MPIGFKSAVFKVLEAVILVFKQSSVPHCTVRGLQNIMILDGAVALVEPARYLYNSPFRRGRGVSPRLVAFRNPGGASAVHARVREHVLPTTGCQCINACVHMRQHSARRLSVVFGKIYVAGSTYLNKKFKFANPLSFSE